jgi:hypothetical protein
MVLSIHLRKSGKQRSEEKGSTLLRHNTGNEGIYPISQETDASLVDRVQDDSAWRGSEAVSLELRDRVCGTGKPIIIAFLSGDRKNR